MEAFRVSFCKVVNEDLEVSGVQVWQFEDELVAGGWLDGSEEIETFKLEVGVDDRLHAFGRDALAEDGQQPTPRFILGPQPELSEPFFCGLCGEFFDLVGQAVLERAYFLFVFFGFEGRGRLGLAFRL